MNGLLFDFENNDIVLTDNGTFATGIIDSQNCAFIAASQVCRITKPEVGEQIFAKLANRKTPNTALEIRNAVSAVQKDGGKNVKIILTEEGNLSFRAEYES